ncbi:hypothetical protein CI109_105163 [Kwoniella shandongensis]|uniref:Uncharacterized protein n=1 Tax=Kwoniella shandongensis TaxID=1734106 RepID=A0A5M6C356_9TREE|nr:uncharacterized protein CI109_002002 [Kwoniella shandongensis]KAA5529577.1 hypothetical protein CI109_002002 [Kwoniella shandongensis]
MPVLPSSSDGPSDHPQPNLPPPSSDPSSSSDSTPPLPPQNVSPDSDDSSTPSSSPSSKLFSQLYNHPSTSSTLFPTLGTSTASILASKYDPSLSYFQSQATASSSTSATAAQPAVIPRMPEKCFSFCTQSDEARPLCRMLCLRKRTPLPTREEQLRRLRPPSVSKSLPSSGITSEITPSASSSASGSLSWLSAPFETLKRKIDPYSIIYVRGTPDGVVGRYMEELEWDDGEYDFGSVSRGVVSGASGKKRNRDEVRGMEWMEWGDQGALLHLPLSTIFHPIVSIPTTLNRILSPSRNFLNTYSSSFTDGAQLRVLSKFQEEVENGGAKNMIDKLRVYWNKRVEETRERREEMLKQRQERVKEVGKEVEGKGE